jgi:hypothetical protein
VSSSRPSPRLLLTQASAALFVTATVLIPATGCLSGNSPQQPPAARQQQPPDQHQQQRQQAKALAQHEAAARDELALIPPPNKRRYLGLPSSDAWVNPLLRVHPDTVTLRIIFPRSTGSPLDGGSSMLHPADARRQELEVRMADLPEALAAIPDYSWPYGRVVAVIESPAADRRDRADVRRNVETTMKMLNDLGVETEELSATTSSSGAQPR